MDMDHRWFMKLWLQVVIEYLDETFWLIRLLMVSTGSVRKFTKLTLDKRLDRASVGNL